MSSRGSAPTNNSISLRRALHLLHLQNNHGEPPSRELIRQRFVAAAKRYHPDARYGANATPCPKSFRQCREARNVLLEHYHGHNGSSRRPGAMRGKQRFAEGFPYRTLRILTLKQNLALRGAVGMFLAVGMAYDYSMKKYQKAKSEKTQ